MRPNIPNQKKAYDALNRRLVNYVAQVLSIYDRIASQVATAIDGVGYDGSAEFLFGGLSRTETNHQWHHDQLCCTDE